MPPEQRRVYDIRDVIGAIGDGGELLEPSARWARNIVIAFCRLNGKTVGVLANRPKLLGGTLEIGVMAASQAVGIIHRRSLAERESEADSERAELATGYAEEHLRVRVAAHEVSSTK